MKLLNCRTIGQVFGYGFTKIEIMRDGKRTVLHEKDLIPYRNYTVGQFERKFNCMIQIE